MYSKDEDYVLLLEDFQEAVILPGSQKEFFTLGRYQKEIGKDFKRITLYICTKSDYVLYERGGYMQEVQDKDKSEVTDESFTSRNKSSATDDEEICSVQIKNDHKLASLHASMNNGNVGHSDKDNEVPPNIHTHPK